jgi:BirA family biotin operon repressor/biotin-[acetyl-CoA-carboxylase] ligase
VLLGDDKLAGVLLEMSAEADSVNWVVAGIGLNVRRPVDGETESSESARGAAYLGDLAPGVRLAEAAAAELDGIAKAYAQWQGGGFAALQADYEARFALSGKGVQVSDLLGNVRVSGVAQGVDGEGRLIVRADDGEFVAVMAGEVTLRG